MRIPFYEFFALSKGHICLLIRAITLFCYAVYCGRLFSALFFRALLYRVFSREIFSISSQAWLYDSDVCLF